MKNLQYNFECKRDWLIKNLEDIIDAVHNPETEDYDTIVEQLKEDFNHLLSRSKRLRG